jgi:hypothetical protein
MTAAKSGSPETIPVGTKVDVEVRITDPGDDTPQSISVDWGDGTTTNMIPGASPRHLYRSPCSHVMEVTIVDEDGATTVERRTIVVEAGLPQVAARPVELGAAEALAPAAADFNKSQTGEAVGPPVPAPNDPGPSLGRLLSLGARELVRVNTAAPILGPGVFWLVAFSMILWWRRQNETITEVTAVRRGRRLAVSEKPGDDTIVRWLDWNAAEVIFTGRNRMVDDREWSQIRFETETNAPGRPRPPLTTDQTQVTLTTIESIPIAGTVMSTVTVPMSSAEQAIANVVPPTAP